MTPEQIIALVGTIVTAPFIIELVKNWFQNRNLRLQTDEKKSESRDAREWEAMAQALERERAVYNDVIRREREEFNRRLLDVEERMSKIQEDNISWQKRYYEEKLQRELLEARVKLLEQELDAVRKSRAL
jgi:hypothetical protein